MAFVYFCFLVSHKTIAMLGQLLSFILLIGFTFQLNAQELERKGTFGIQMEALEDSSGIEVLKVFDHTTASALGLEVNDILLSVNGKSYSDVMDLVGEVGTWRIDKPITIVLKRGDNQQTVSGKVVGKPLETSEYGKVTYGSVNFDGGQLRSILEVPHGVKNPPVVLFLPGVGCGSLDYYYNPSATIKLLVESLVAEGIAVCRVEKPGMGDSQGTKNCLEMDFNYEVAAFAAAVKQLKRNTDIDADHIFLYGHSLGSISAPLIAAKNKVAGIIAWGGIASTWYEYSLKTHREQEILFGTDYVELEQDFRMVLPFLHDFLVNKKTPQELTEIAEYQKPAKYYFKGETVYGLHHYTYFQTLNEVDVLTAYKNANCPVLAIAGEHDVHTIDTRWAKTLADVVNFYRPNTGKSIVIPKTTHHYHTVPSIEVYNELRKTGKMTGAYKAEHFNEDVPFVIQKWVKEQVLASGETMTQNVEKK